MKCGRETGHRWSVGNIVGRKGEQGCSYSAPSSFCGGQSPRGWTLIWEEGIGLTTPHKLQAEARPRKRAERRPGVSGFRKPMAAGVSASCGS